MREESAKKKARERDEDKKMAKRLDATRENDNRIEQEKIRERERERSRRAQKSLTGRNGSQIQLQNDRYLGKNLKRAIDSDDVIADSEKNKHHNKINLQKNCIENFKIIKLIKKQLIKKQLIKKAANYERGIDAFIFV